MGSVKAGYECIKAFSETDFTEDLKAIDVPVLVIHSEDDQIVPYADSGAAVGQAAEERHAQDLQGPAARLRSTHPDLINADLLAFIEGREVGEAAEEPKVEVVLT